METKMLHKLRKEMNKKWKETKRIRTIMGKKNSKYEIRFKNYFVRPIGRIKILFQSFVDSS
jgi:hypothetical protein